MPSKCPFGTLLLIFGKTHHNLVGGIRGNILVKRRDFKNIIDNASSDPLGKILSEILGRSGHGTNECSKIHRIYGSKSHSSIIYRERNTLVKVGEYLRLTTNSLLVIITMVRSY